MKVKKSGPMNYKVYAVVCFNSKKERDNFYHHAHVNRDLVPCAVWVRKNPQANVILPKDVKGAVVWRLEPNYPRETYEALGFIKAQIESAEANPLRIELWGC